MGRRERLAVRFHLMMCVHCRRFVRHVRHLVAALARRPAPDDRDPDADYVERVLAALPADDSAPTGDSPAND